MENFMQPRCLTSGYKADYADTPDQKLKPLNIKRFSLHSWRSFASWSESIWIPLNPSLPSADPLDGDLIKAVKIQRGNANKTTMWLSACPVFFVNYMLQRHETGKEENIFSDDIVW